MRPMGKGKGKRKIAMELIKDKQSRMVSFSKRRQGLMKKAEEFYSITGSPIALIVLSEAGRPFVYGAPCFDSLIHRFQHQNDITNHNYNELLLTHSHPHPSLSLPDLTLLTGLGRHGQAQAQGSNQKHHNSAVHGTHTQTCTTTTIPPDPSVPQNNYVMAHVADQIQEPPWPTAFFPDHISGFDPPSEFFVGQGSTFTTDSDDQENADFDLIDLAPWLAASPDHSFHAPPPPKSLIGQGSTTDYSHQQYDDSFYLLDTAPWLAASPDHPFHTSPEVVSITFQTLPPLRTTTWRPRNHASPPTLIESEGLCKFSNIDPGLTLC